MDEKDKLISDDKINELSSTFLSEASGATFGTNITTSNYITLDSGYVGGNGTYSNFHSISPFNPNSQLSNEDKVDSILENIETLILSVESLKSVAKDLLAEMRTEKYNKRKLNLNKK